MMNFGINYINTPPRYAICGVQVGHKILTVTFGFKPQWKKKKNVSGGEVQSENGVVSLEPLLPMMFGNVLLFCLVSCNE